MWHFRVQILSITITKERITCHGKEKQSRFYLKVKKNKNRQLYSFKEQ